MHAYMHAYMHVCMYLCIYVCMCVYVYIYIYIYIYIFSEMLCMKRVYRDKQASIYWSAARNEERFSFR